MYMVIKASPWVMTEYDGRELPMRTRVEVRRCRTKIRMRMEVKDEGGAWRHHRITTWHRRKEIKTWLDAELDAAAEATCDAVIRSILKDDAEVFWASMGLDVPVEVNSDPA